jgi:hypothetical protein
MVGPGEMVKWSDRLSAVSYRMKHWWYGGHVVRKSSSVLHLAADSRAPITARAVNQL